MESVLLHGVLWFVDQKTNSGIKTQNYSMFPVIKHKALDVDMHSMYVNRTNARINSEL